MFMYKYKIIVDVGIPYTITVYSDEQLEQELRELKDKAETEPCFHMTVLDVQGNDISETQFIEELIQEIINDN